MNQIFDLPSLKELYSRPYDDTMREWRRLGAIDKAAHIVDMTASHDDAPIEKILEVGCGTGDVMAELAKAGVGRSITGVEIGTERSQTQKRTINRIELSISAYDGQTLPFDDDSFDLVYATHVLEHVVHERAFLSELRRVSKGLIYVEVPLEQLARSKVSSFQTSLSLAGHINPYSLESFLLRLETSGLKVQRHQLFDHAIAVFAFSNSPAKARMKKAIRGSALKFFPGVARRIFSYHCGALCRVAPKLDID